MLANQRIYHLDGATLEDKSVSLNTVFDDAAVVDLLAGEYLYIGSTLPFNHRHFQISVANDVASVASVELWDGNEWISAVDVIDQTSVAGVTLARSGMISWTTPRNGSWGQAATTEDVTGLTTLKVYDLYWVRLTVSVSLKATTALQYVGHKFANDNDLGGRYADLVTTAIMDAFETGKTTWDEQHLLAAEDLIQDIRRKGIAWNANQILDWEQFNLAAVHKVASIIMFNFGDDYRDNRLLAEKEYEKAMNLKIFEVDRNEDGRRDEVERQFVGGIVRR